jgi:serine acetyltransferase
LPAAKIVCIVDSNPNTVGGSLSGVRIESPSLPTLQKADCVVICASAFVEVRRQVAQLGFAGDVHYIYELFLEKEHEMSEFEKLAIDISATRNKAWPIFIFEKPQILVNISFRTGRWLAERPLLLPFYWLFWIIHHLFSAVLGIQLPLATEIGPGLVFAHFGTIVFTARARIGAFFTIYHCCTVGTNDSGMGPRIGDFVTQYAGAHVLGASVIGAFSRVGANSVVLDLVASDESTVVGSPARIVAAGR